MRKSTESTYHQPAVVAQPACIERCKKLPELVAAAALEAVAHPDDQKVVVCSRLGKMICHGSVLTEGSYGHNFGEAVEESDDLYLPNPINYQSGTRNFSVTGEVDDAVSNGAQRYTTRGLEIIPQEIEVVSEQ